jgi:hypothetical protein
LRRDSKRGGCRVQDGEYAENEAAGFPYPRHDDNPAASFAIMNGLDQVSQRGQSKNGREYNGGGKGGAVIIEKLCTSRTRFLGIVQSR